MIKFSSIFLLIVFCALATWGHSVPQENQLRVLEGKFLEIKQNFLFMEAPPDIRFRIAMDKRIKIVSPAGAFSLNWLLPGDGIRVFLNENGRASKIEAFASWIFGTVAFASPDRLTLLEGPQFFTDQAPLLFNGQEIPNISVLKPPNEALIRFDSLRKKTVGVWAFDRTDSFKQGPNSFQNNFWIAASIEKNELRIGVNGKPSGKLFARLLGATQKVRLLEKHPGHYQTALLIPRGVNLPRSYLQFEWLGWVEGQKVDLTWICAKPISFYTQAPRVTDLGPAGGSTVPLNPPFIFANFDPNKAPLDLSSVRLLLDKKNVTPECYVDSYLVFYSPEILSPGKHKCLLSGRTLGGQGAFNLKWSFHV